MENQHKLKWPAMTVAQPMLKKPTAAGLLSARLTFNKASWLLFAALQSRPRSKESIDHDRATERD